MGGGAAAAAGTKAPAWWQEQSLTVRKHKWLYKDDADANAAATAAYRTRQLSLTKLMSVATFQTKALTKLVEAPLSFGDKQVHVYWWWGKKQKPQPSDAVSPTLVRLVSIGSPRIVYGGSMGWVDSNIVLANEQVVVVYLKDVDLSNPNTQTLLGTHTVILIATTSNAITALKEAYGTNWTQWPSLYVCPVEDVVPVVKDAVKSKLKSWLLPLSSAGRYKRFQVVKKAAEGLQSGYAKQATMLWELLGTNSNVSVATSNVSPFLTEDSTVLPRALMVSETMYKAVQQQSLLSAVSNDEDLARNVGIVLTRTTTSIFKGRGNVPQVCSIVLNLLDPPRTLAINDTVEPSMPPSSSDSTVTLPHSPNAIQDEDIQSPIDLGYVMVASRIVTAAVASAAPPVTIVSIYVNAVNAFLSGVCSAPGSAFTSGTSAQSSVGRVFTCSDVSGTLMAVDAAMAVSLTEYRFQGCFVDAVGNLYVRILDNFDDLGPSVSFVDHGWVVRRENTDDSEFLKRFKQRTTVIDPTDRNNALTQQLRTFNVIKPAGTKRGLDVKFAVLTDDGSKKVRVDKKVSVPGVLEISADKRFLYTNQDAEYYLLGLTADQVNAVPSNTGTAKCYSTKNIEPATLYPTVTANTRNLLSLFAPPKTEAIVITGGALVRERMFKQDDPRSRYNFVYGNAVVDIFGTRAYESVIPLYDDQTLKSGALSPFDAPAVSGDYARADAADNAIVVALTRLSATAATIITKTDGGRRISSTGVLETMDEDNLKELATRVHTFAGTLTGAMAVLRSFSDRVRALYVPALPNSEMLTRYEQVTLQSLKSDPSSIEPSYALGTPEQIQGIRSMVEWLQTVQLFS